MVMDPDLYTILYHANNLFLVACLCWEWNIAAVLCSVCSLV